MARHQLLISMCTRLSVESVLATTSTQLMVASAWEQTGPSVYCTQLLRIVFILDVIWSTVPAKYDFSGSVELTSASLKHLSYTLKLAQPLVCF